MPENCLIARGAQVIGKVNLGENVGIWYNAVVRGDTNTITIGDNSNIQDNATLGFFQFGIDEMPQKD